MDESHKFHRALLKELITHFEQEHWELKTVQEITDGTKLLNSVWPIR